MNYTKPIFSCGHPCNWSQYWWVTNPKAGLYCGECQATRRIATFPDLYQQGMWPDDYWDRPSTAHVVVAVTVEDDGFEEADRLYGDIVEDFENSFHVPVWTSLQYRTARARPSHGS